MKIIPLPPSEQLRPCEQVKEIPALVQSGILYTYQVTLSVLEYKNFHDRTYQELQEFFYNIHIKLGKLVGGLP